MRLLGATIVAVLGVSCSDEKGGPTGSASAQSQTPASPAAASPQTETKPQTATKTQTESEPEAETEAETETVPSLSPEELERRRAQVIQQVDSLREAELTVGGVFGFEDVPGPVPPELPGTQAHDWTPADSEAMAALSWSPRPGGGGRTYAQFSISLSEDGQDFTVRATTDLDGDGVRATVEASKSEKTKVLDPSVW